MSLQTRLNSLGSQLKHGTVDSAAIQSANRDTSTIGAQSASKGKPIQDQPTPQLGG